MRILWEGKTFDYDPSAIDVKTAVVIKHHTGLGLVSWSKAVDDWDPLAVQALLWAVKTQAGERCDIATLNFSVGDFMEAFNLAAFEDMQRILEADERRAEVDPPSLAGDGGVSIPAPMPISAS